MIQPIKDSYKTKVLLSAGGGNIIPIGSKVNIVYSVLTIGTIEAITCHCVIESQRPSLNGIHLTANGKFLGDYFDLNS